VHVGGCGRGKEGRETRVGTRVVVLVILDGGQSCRRSCRLVLLAGAVRMEHTRNTQVWVE